MHILQDSCPGAGAVPIVKANRSVATERLEYGPRRSDDLKQFQVFRKSPGNTMCRDFMLRSDKLLKRWAGMIWRHAIRFPVN